MLRSGKRLSSVVLASMVCWGCGGGDGDHQAPSPTPSDSVYVSPQFVEVVSSDLTPQILVQEWEVVGAHGGKALPGSTVVVRLRSPFYEPVDAGIVVPDTCTVGPGNERRYYPLVPVQRVVPALLRAEWSADFTGPSIRAEVYAPYDVAGVKFTASSVVYSACRPNGPDPCETRLQEVASGTSWSDPSASGQRAWAVLVGPWRGWPTDLPPEGFYGLSPERNWAATVWVDIEDDRGHVGAGSCGVGSIPGPSVTLRCETFFNR